jgi:hypothetical protein
MPCDWYDPRYHDDNWFGVPRTRDGAIKEPPMFFVVVFVTLYMLAEMDEFCAATPLSSAPPPPLPVEQNATCGSGKNAVLYTRHEIWADCFMRLGGMARPRPGELDVNKVSRFRSEHLYPWERWFTPSAEQIVQRCDQPPFDGWVTQQEFEGTLNRLCLADADAICHARDVCERETRHLGGG